MVLLCLLMINKVFCLVFAYRLPIHFAAAGGSTQIILCFNEVGADITLRDKLAYTSIHYAAMFGNFDALKLLWANGAAKLDDKSYSLLVQTGVTPLHLGAQSGSKEVVEFLIKNGGQINGRTNDGLTPLHYAIKGGKLEMVKFLITNGADKTITDIYGVFTLYIYKTSVQIAMDAKQNDIVDYFIGSKVTDNSKDKVSLLFDSAENGNIPMLQKLLDDGVDPNSENEYGVYFLFSYQTPIHLAVRFRHKDAISLLLSYGGDIDWEDKGVLHIKNL